ncbi:MAG TPA: DNA-binding protein [Cyclobacteriaceae bacterium]|nr:DNA-binding protein [Cyclobacteriaceae bacterium]
MTTYALRLKPHEDVKVAIMKFAVEHKLQAACILAAVGSLEQYHIRFANQEKGVLQAGHFEVVSLSGLFTSSDAHLHISVADEQGKTVGGHLLDENRVYTTLELVIGELTDVTFDRVVDSTYGYKELTVTPRKHP